MPASFFQVLTVFLLSAVKFLFAPTLGLSFGFGFGKTLIITTIGGTCGVFIFYYFGTFIFKSIDKLKLRFSKGKPPKKKRLFSKRSRWFVIFKKRFGLPGLAMLTPTILSIPVGTILVSKYFQNPYKAIPVLIASVFFWSLLLTIVGHYFGISIQ